MTDRRASTCSNNTQTELRFFCSGSASIPRGFLSPVLNLRMQQPEKNPCPAGLNEVIEVREPQNQQNCSSASRKM